MNAIGLPAALIGKLAGLNLHVMNRVTSGPKADLVGSLGAAYDLAPGLQLAFELDVIIECTGIWQVIPQSILKIDVGGPVFLRGVGRGGAEAVAVLQNNAIVGSVNPTRKHGYKAGEVPARADLE